MSSTTAATSSASPRTPNDDSPMQDNIGASDPTQTPPDQQPQDNNQQQTQQQSPPQLQNSPTQQQPQPQQQQQPTSNHIEQKRPMNAFLLFCKRQRSLVREKYPNLENRNITRILGDWWSKLDKEQKDKYTDLARQHKEAFMKANPDFKWCKTPMSNNNISNNNNHNNYNSNSNSNSNNVAKNDCFAAGGTANNRQNNKSSNPAQVDVGPSNSSGRETLTNRTLAQHEAPKPPKKRFLERNDSNYTKNSFSASNNESIHHAKDGIVPYISLDQDTLDRVIDEAFSERSNSNSASGINMCKCSNRLTSTNFKNNSSMSVTNQSPFSVSTPYPDSNNDEPVDFSMNRTISTTSQQIINNLVETMLSEPDNICSTSNLSSTNIGASNISQPGLAKRETKHDET